MSLPAAEAPIESALPGNLNHLGDERKLTRMVLGIAWPAILENSMHTLLGIVDTILVARLGTDAIAGVGAGAQWMFMFFSVVFGLSMGSVVIVARAIGGGDVAAANRAARQSLLIGLAAGLAFTVLGAWLAEPAIALLGADAHVTGLGAEYLRIISYGGVFTSLAIVSSSLLRAAGDTRTPMYATAVANVVNAGFAYVLIFGHFGFPALGVGGSAWALNIARIVSIAIIWWAMMRGQILRLSFDRAWRPAWSLIRQMLAFGAPSVAEQILLMASFMAYAAITFNLGTVAFAAQRLTFNAITISFMPAFGFAIAATTLTGQALGARRPDLADRTTWTATRLAAMWMGAMGVVYALLAEPLLRVFTDDPAILAEGVPALLVIGVASPLLAVPFVLSGSLRGAGDTRFPLVISFVTGWLIRVPIGYFAGITLGLGLWGIYVGILGDAAVGGAMAVWRYRRGGWRELKVSLHR